MCLAPPKAVPAFLQDGHIFRKRGKATLAAARAAEEAATLNKNVDILPSGDVDVDVDVKANTKSGSSTLLDDIVCLKTMWFSKSKGDSHEERLSSFYAPQASAYDAFRSRFLWARRPMLAAAAARLAPEQGPLVWVDLGGGTGENVVTMTERYLPLERFAAIYIVDLAEPLCEQARLKVESRPGWKGKVHVVHGDATTFVPPPLSPPSRNLGDNDNDGQASLGTVDLVTFSYSLSMIPNFLDAVDRAAALLKPRVGVLGVADFYAAAKRDHPHRAMPWARRFFWQAVFDTDGISIGPERRAALDHRFERLWEENGEGAIPYVPYLRAPWYAWVGRAEDTRSLRSLDAAAVAAGGAVFAAQQRHVEPAPEAPSSFPPTFLYTMSWEDPRADEDHLQLGPGVRSLLTLTSGGDNSLTALLSGCRRVVSVDVNPAQSALLELKAAALKSCEGGASRTTKHALSYDDVWKLFGEGRHERAAEIYERSLAPLLSQSARAFWSPRVAGYFGGSEVKESSGGTSTPTSLTGSVLSLLGFGYLSRGGLYFQGGMGKLVAAIHVLARLLGLRSWLRDLRSAATLEEQRAAWRRGWPVRLFSSLERRAPLAADLLSSLLAFALFNRLVLWFGAGVPVAQYEMIEKGDGVRLSSYAARTLAGVATRTHLRSDNYFYASCLNEDGGGYVNPEKGGCCPAWMTREGVSLLRSVDDDDDDDVHDDNAGGSSPVSSLSSSSSLSAAARAAPAGRPRSLRRVVDRLDVRSCTFVDALKSGEEFDRVILMDHVDWADERYAKELAEALAGAVPRGGRVIWRSASLRPWYALIIARAGFDVRRVGAADEAEGGLLDLVNMYASFWVAVRK